jgi:hypothetical protein
MAFVLFLNVRTAKGGIPSVLLEWYTAFKILTTQEIIFVSDISPRKFMSEQKKYSYDQLWMKWHWNGI